MKARWSGLPGGERGQALPLALVAFAVGSLAVMPFLVSATSHLLARRQADRTTADRYSADAAIEWGLWRLKGDATLTTATTYTNAPLRPTPAAINGGRFPLVQIRLVADAAALETVAPAWQSGRGKKCYSFTSTDGGSVYAKIETSAATVKADLRTGCAGRGLPRLSGSSPYVIEFAGRPAGSYELVVKTDPPSPGALIVSYPIATYDLRSQANGRTVTARVTASTSSIRVLSWLLD